MGWDGLLLLNILHNNQLKELGNTSNNTMVTLPVHVFLGKTNVRAIDFIVSLFTDILGNLLSDYTADAEDTKDTCSCVKLYCR